MFIDVRMIIPLYLYKTAGSFHIICDGLNGSKRVVGWQNAVGGMYMRAIVWGWNAVGFIDCRERFLGIW